MKQQNEHFGNSEQLNKSVDHIGDANKMVTAVEWLIEQYENGIMFRYDELKIQAQAKAMEKEQIINACNAFADYPFDENDIQQYYNETYSK